MLALRQNCIHPTTKEPYMLDSSGGRDISPEGHQVVVSPFLSFSFPSPSHSYLPSGLDCGRKRRKNTNDEQGGFSHCFVSHFASEEDRTYYLEEDPAHLAFKKSLEGIVQNVRVVDYEPGEF